jgi:hypothetical protein
VRKIPSILIACFILLGSCTSSPQEARVNTPAGVARIWLENYYHTNDYDVAKSYSTNETAAMIDTIKGMIFPDLEDTDPIPFKIENIRCKQTKGAQTAQCSCTYKEGETSFTENLILVLQDGQWLVDVIDESDNMLEDKEIEKMTKDFESTLDRMLEQ